MKTDRYYIELLYAPIIAIVGGVINLLFPELIGCKDPTVIIAKSIDISFIIFGFLLTVLALILQSTQEIRGRKLYTRLIRFNRRIVYLALISGFYSLIYNSLFEPISQLKVKELFVSVFILLFIWIILDLLHFIRIFYKLAEEGKI